MDFGFMRASTSNFSKPNKKDDRVVLSYDGFSSYLLIVDEATHFIWVFLTKSIAPPLDILDTFFARFGHERLVLLIYPTSCSGNIITLWNLLARIAPSRMVLSRYTRTSLLFAHGLFSMELASQPSTGLRRCNTPSTYTTGSSTPSPNRPHSRLSMDINPTSAT